MYNYTVELRQIKNVFDFDYPFYEEQFKCDFEEKFIKHYYFDEIGFETIERFKQRLEAKLYKKMPYWSQLYETELEAEGIAFLLNKDLKESFIRTVDTEDKILGTSTTNESTSSNGQVNDTKNYTSNTKEVANGTNSGTENGKVSNVADGVASASLETGLLTGVNEQKTTGTSNVDTTNTGSGNETGTKTNSSSETSSQNGKNTEDRNGKLLEKTELVSQGNIGTTSSAELLDKWRSVLINIDELIIDECQDLFMGIF